MKKVLMAEYLEYNSPFKVGNHHYAKSFAHDGYNVLWLSPVYNQLYFFKDRELYFEKKRVSKRQFVSSDKNIYCYAPYSLMLYGNIPFLRSKVANKLSIDMTLPSINNVLFENNFHKVDILWLSNPKYYYLSEMIDYKLLIYRCTDDLSGFNIVPKSMLYFERKVIEKADIVFVTSQNLLNKKKLIRDDLIYLPNGVELNNFIRDNYEMPEEYKNNNRPKCIYIGAIDHWFDIDLVRYSAEKLAEIDFYLIGPTKISVDHLKELKNVYLLGKKDYKEIPNYLKHSDVAIIPFLVNSLTDSIAPIKLYEYMSVGLNVVTTNFKEMRHINSPAYLANDYEQFCKNIKLALNKEDNKDANINFATDNTWLARYNVIEKKINSLLSV